MDRAELEALPTKQLHDRAMSAARQRMDIAFLWKLINMVPPAEAAAGHLRDADTDIMSLSSLLSDVVHSGEGELGEALRPLYIDYLAEHG